METRGERMIDVHSHVLPGLDDGSKDLDTSIAMLKKYVQEGTDGIIVTPHYIKGRYEVSYEMMLESLHELKDNIKNLGVDIELYPGQEIYLDNSSIDLFKNGIIRGLNGSRYALVELPMDSWSDSYVDLMYELGVLGAVPIVAHPERYRYVQDDLRVLNGLIREGCLFQINAGSLLGTSGKSAEATAIDMIKNGLANFMASDAHNSTRRPAGLIEAFDKVYKIDRKFEDYALDNAELIIEDQEIEANFELPVRKSIFQMIRRNI